MSFQENKKIIETMMEKNYREFIKALISIEVGIEDQEKLEVMYDAYMENDGMLLISEEFYQMLETND